MALKKLLAIQTGTANIALYTTPTGLKLHHRNPKGLEVGQRIVSGPVDIKIGNVLFHLQTSQLVQLSGQHRASLGPGKGAELIRAAGSCLLFGSRR